METLKYKKLSVNASAPSRGSAGAVGYDLSAAITTSIAGGGKGLIPTDLAIIIPPGHYGRIAPRSGLSWKKHIDVGAGVIDPDYTGNVGVVLFNHGSDTLEITQGDRIAQLLLERVSTPPVEEVIDTSETKRGASGFGSTGK